MGNRITKIIHNLWVTINSSKTKKISRSTRFLKTLMPATSPCSTIPTTSSSSSSSSSSNSPTTHSSNSPMEVVAISLRIIQHLGSVLDREITQAQKREPAQSKFTTHLVDVQISHCADMRDYNCKSSAVKV